MIKNKISYLASDSKNSFLYVFIVSRSHRLKNRVTFSDLKAVKIIKTNLFFSHIYFSRSHCPAITQWRRGKRPKEAVKQVENLNKFSCYDDSNSSTRQNISCIVPSYNRLFSQPGCSVFKVEVHLKAVFCLGISICNRTTCCPVWK